MIKTDHTKMLLAESLKEIMNKKPLKSISVQDIVENCGLSRHTFYYHFFDRQELVNWIYSYDILNKLRPVSQFSQFDHWGEALEIMKRDQKFYRNAHTLEGRNSLEEFALHELLTDFLSVVDKYTDKGSIDDASRIFIAKFYSCSVSKMTIDWVKEGMKESPELLKRRLVNTVDGGIRTAVKKSI